MDRCPAYNRGRWYKLFIESNGSEVTIPLKSGLDVEISGNHIKFPQLFRIVDFKGDFDNSPITAATGFGLSGYKYANGQYGITLPAAATFTDANIYVFGYFDR